MSKEGEKESVAFGDFSSDEVKVLLNDNESAVQFSDPVSVGGGGSSSDTKRQQYSTAAAPSSPAGIYSTTIAPPPTLPPTFQGPPEFLFSVPSADYTKNYQFGSLPTTLVMSLPQVGSFVSAGGPLNSVSSGRGSVRLNVFAKEFVPAYVPPHLSIISKGEGGVVMGGAYTIPPMMPQPFMFPHPSYGAPPILYPALPLQMMSHAHVGLRPPGGAGPQVAVVAPYRAAHEARPLFVPPEKNYERMTDSMSDETGGGSNQVKSLSLSPQATPTATPTTTRSLSVGDVRGIGTSNNDINNNNGRSQDENEGLEVADEEPIDDQEVVSDSKADSSSPPKQSPPPATPPPITPPLSPPTFPSADVNSTSSITRPTQNESTINSLDNNYNDDITTTDDTCNDGRPLDKDTGDTGRLVDSNDSDQSSPQDNKPHPQCNKPHPSNDKHIESQSDSVTVSDRPHPSNDKPHPPNLTVSDKPHPPNDKSSGKGATGNSSSRSWAAVVGKNSQQAPPTSQGPRSSKDSSSKVGVASKLGGVAEGLSKDELSKLEEMKVQRLQHFGRQLEGKGLNHNSISILPRGLINSSNHCFIHAPLQALISCPEFTNLLRSLNTPKMASNDASSLATIVTENMVKFIEHFSSTYPLKPSYDSNGRRKKAARDFSYEKPFRPDFIYEILPKIKSTLSIQGRQEDAEEFLSCFLNKLHEEMVAAKQSVLTPPPITSANETQDVKTGDNERGGVEEEEEWQEVGPKNKSTITRQTEYLSSPISEIFGGRYHSTLHRQGMKVSATVEPFFSLLLDIKHESVKSVRDALELLATKEPVDLPEKDGIGATRRTTLIHLPHVLILQLKRFVFEGSKCLKLHKNISYEHELEIPKELLAPPVKGKITASQRSYTLWAIVYHCGESPNGGHYITEAYHQQYGGWLRYDDNYVKPINSEQLFRLPHRVPYLFFYRQSESGTGGSLGFTNSASNHHTSGGSGRY